MIKKLLIILLALIQLTCSKEQKVAKKYKGCCNTETVQANLGGNLIYIPNIFTPNGDAFNDLFKPFFDKKTTALEEMIIKADNNTAFKITESDTSQPFWGWFGLIDQETRQEGLFSYVMTFRDIKTGEKKTIKGEACAAFCDDDNTLIQLDDTEKCSFPAQYRDGQIIESPLHFGLEIDCLRQ